MQKQKLMLFSGFLGSGKTTTMIETAKYLQKKGLKVSLITNDLGENLVDTNYAALSGVSVTEIPNGCLCHDVPGFLEALRQVINKDAPDYVFAEPVGSCVGLVHSVYQELDTNFSEQIQLLPFVSVVDPNRYYSIYIDESQNTFNEEATYMYKKQLEDADTILLNKCDIISEDFKQEILISLEKEFPSATIVSISAVENKNFQAWTNTFLDGQKPSLRNLDIDWDYLFNGQKHMGWYNNALRISCDRETNYSEFLDQLMKNIQDHFIEKDLEIAHLKILCYAENQFCKAALTSTKQPISYSGNLNGKQKNISCNINIRAIADPKIIADIINDSIDKTANNFHLTMKEHKEQAFDCFDSAPEPVNICSCSCTQ